MPATPAAQRAARRRSARGAHGRGRVRRVSRESDARRAPCASAIAQQLQPRCARAGALRRRCRRDDLRSDTGRVPVLGARSAWQIAATSRPPSRRRERAQRARRAARRGAVARERLGLAVCSRAALEARLRALGSTSGRGSARVRRRRRRVGHERALPRDGPALHRVLEAASACAVTRTAWMRGRCAAGPRDAVRERSATPRRASVAHPVVSVRGRAPRRHLARGER